MIQIDLSEYEAPVSNFIRDSVAGFAAENPDVEVSAIGLSGTGFHGDVAIHFDTPVQSAAHVKQWSAQGPAWYGEDAFGRFNNNCENFAYARFNEFQYPKYPNFYEVPADEQVVVSTLDDQDLVINRNEGDEAFNLVIFPFLKAVLKLHEPFQRLRHADLFRAGVQMIDSNNVEFWRV